MDEFQIYIEIKKKKLKNLMSKKVVSMCWVTVFQLNLIKNCIFAYNEAKIPTFITSK